MKILVAEDDVPLAKVLRAGLETESYAVAWAADGPRAQQLAEEGNFDLLLLDVNLPRMSGWEVLSRVRQRKPAVPVLLLTAQSRVEDRVRGLDLGADDYLIKPFSFRELSARIRALLRRADPVLRVDTLELNPADRSVRRAGWPIELSPTEFAMLEVLMRNAEHCVSHATLATHLRGRSVNAPINLVRVYINYLRAKVDGGRRIKLIQSVRGAGYRLTAAGNEDET